MKYGILNSIFTLILLLLVHINAAADHFANTLHSLRAESQAQQVYFKALADEYGDQYSLLEKPAPGKLLTPEYKEKFSSPLTFHYMALDSHFFWLAMRNTIDIIAEEYGKVDHLTNPGQDKFQLSPIQYALGFLLEQVSHSGLVAYGDLVINYNRMGTKHQALPKTVENLRSALVCAGIAKILDDIEQGNQREPDSHAHMIAKIDILAKLLRTEFGKSDLYRIYFLDFNSLHSMFNSLKSFYSSTPIPGQTLLNFGKDITKWSDVIRQRSEHWVLEDKKSSFKQLSSVQSSDGPSLLTSLLNMFEPQFRAKLRRAKENHKKRMKAKTKLALPKLAEEQLPVGPEAVYGEEVEQKAQPLLVPPSYDDEDLPHMSYIDWVREQRELSLRKKTSAQADLLELPPEKIRLFGGAMKIYKTAMGLGSFQTTNNDLWQLLRQVGGYFVKCSGPHSDRKIALPNYSKNATEEFWVDKMHLMHSGRDIFPAARLKTHLRRMIEMSGLNELIVVD